MVPTCHVEQIYLSYLSFKVMSGGTAISSEDIVSSLQKLHNSSGRAGVGGTYAYSKYKVYKSARMVNFINAGGGDPLCTLHRAE